MNPTAEQRLDAALALPDQDRVEFVEALIGSLQPADRLPLGYLAPRSSSAEPPS